MLSMSLNRGGVKLSYVREVAYLANTMGRQVAPMDVSSIYVQRQVDWLIQELGVQELTENGNEESSWNSLPRLCGRNNPSNLSSNDSSALGSKLSKFTVSNLVLPLHPKQ